MDPKTSKTASPSKWNNAPLYALLLLLGLLALLSITPEFSQKDAVAPKLTLEERLDAAVHMRTLPPVPPRQWKPNTAIIPSIPKRASGLQVLRLLVETHPHPLINTDLKNAIISKRIALEDGTQTGTAGSFSLGQLDRVKVLSGQPQSEVFPVLSLPLDKLTKMRYERDVIFWWVILYHESLHWDQWRKAKTAAERERFLPWKKQKIIELSEAKCESIFLDEIEAHSLECDLVREFEWVDLYPVDACRYEGGADRDYAIFIRFLYPRHKNLPTCLATWARMAGHPDPSVFSQFE